MTNPRLRSPSLQQWLLLVGVAIGYTNALTIEELFSTSPPPTPTPIPIPTLTPPPTPTLTPTSTPAPTTPTDPICILTVDRLVFTLADLSKQNCATPTDMQNARCSSLCWCRQWASSTVTSTTLAQCVPMNQTSTCVGQDQRDCRAAIAAQPTSSPSSSNKSDHASSNSGSSQALRNNQASEKDGDGKTSAGIYVLVTLLCVAFVGGILFVVNWYRNRPLSVSEARAPATVSGGEQSSQGGPLTWTDLDSYDEKLPPAQRGSRPNHRGSIHSLAGGSGSGRGSIGGSGGSSSARGSISGYNLVPIDVNASILSGVSGASYHDLDGTRLGHLNEAHALTDTELSLSRDAARPHVFSPVSADGNANVSDSQLSTDSIDVDLHRQAATMTHAYSPSAASSYSVGPPPSEYDSSFISVASTTYLTNNDTFASQLTATDSDAGGSIASTSISSSSTARETEF